MRVDSARCSRSDGDTSMTRDDALRHLGLSPQDGPDAVRKALDIQGGDLARRIAAAPTEALRATYEAQAARLRDARDVLVREADGPSAPSPLSLTQQRDLPARTPPSATGMAPQPGA